MRTFTTTLLALVGVLAAGSAHALGPSLGIRGGAGLVIWQDAVQEPDAQPIAFGPAARLDLGVLTFEADLLWNRTSWVTSGTKTTLDRVSTPLLGKLNLPLAPGLANLSFGAGIEPRWLIGAEAGGRDVAGSFADTTLYVPVVAGVDVDLKAAQFNVELRYAHQIEPEGAVGDTRAHQFMVMGGLFF